MWVDREHDVPEAESEAEAAGAAPANPLFGHIVSALAGCDAVVYVTSPTSLEREYVGLEFDPRILFQEYLTSDPRIDPGDPPFYTALVSRWRILPSSGRG